MRSQRTCLTLIEVLAAVCLLATLLGMVVVASARHARQTRLAQDRFAAQQVAEGLLRQWLTDPGGRIEEPRGAVEGRPNWEWRLSGRASRGLEPLGLHIGRLEIVRLPTGGNSVEPVTLAEVEFASSSVVTAESAARGASP